MEWCGGMCGNESILLELYGKGKQIRFGGKVDKKDNIWLIGKILGWIGAFMENWIWKSMDKICFDCQFLCYG